MKVDGCSLAFLYHTRPATFSSTYPIFVTLILSSHYRCSRLKASLMLCEEFLFSKFIETVKYQKGVYTVLWKSKMLNILQVRHSDVCSCFALMTRILMCLSPDGTGVQNVAVCVTISNNETSSPTAYET